MSEETGVQATQLNELTTADAETVSGAELAGSASPAPEVNPATNPKQDLQPGEKLRVRVVDLLGNAIQNATLEAGGRAYTSADGSFAIADAPEGGILLSASAAGYESAQQRAASPSQEVIEIALDYLCTFEIQVHEAAAGNAVEGAEVALWTGSAIERPPPLTISAIVGETDIEYLQGKIFIQRKEDSIRVSGVQGIHGNPFSAIEGISGGLRHQPAFIPRVGDKIVDAGRMLPHPDGANILERWNSLLRFWDSVVSICRANDSPGISGFLEIEGRQRERIAIQGMPQPNRDHCIERRTTDAFGVCVFRDMPRRVYFAEVLKDDAQSYCHIILPYQKTVRLLLYPQNGNRLRVIARKAGYHSPRESGIQNAQVELRGTAPPFSSPPRQHV